MTNTQHNQDVTYTPGPWEVERLGHGLVIFDATKDIPIAILQFINTNTEANAQLIAQAPTLLDENLALKAELEALKALNAELVEALVAANTQLDECYRTLYGFNGTVTDNTYTVISNVSDLIAKAKGVQN